MTLLTAAVRDLALSLPAGHLPAYVYDLDALREHAAFVRSVLPERVELYYAAKANPEAEILTALAPYTDGFEVSSGGELAHVATSVPGHALAFGGPGKTPEEIESALLLGVERFHVESAYELRMLADLAERLVPRVRIGVLLRFNLPVPADYLESSALAMGGRPAPFGIDPSQADGLVRQLTDGSFPQLELLGVHAHLASGLTARQQLAVAESVVVRASELAARHRIALREVNVGGGMAVDYADPDARFDWSAFGSGLARIADDHPGLAAAHRTRPRPHRLLRLVRHRRAGCEAQPRRGLRGRARRDPPSAHPCHQGARPAVRRPSPRHLAASLATGCGGR